MKVVSKFLSKFLLYLWQLPQNLLGLLLVHLFGAIPIIYFGHAVWLSPKMRGGISLGRYIIIHGSAWSSSQRISRNTVLHEYGHQRQSQMLGWFYLPTVGLVSGLRAWLNLYKNGHYYDGWPENWADSLGHVQR